MKWFVKALRQYADFNGRARRMEYWVFRLLYLGIGFVLFMLELAISGVFSGNEPEFFFPVITGLYLLGMLIPSLAVTVRRLHDTGRSGWWFLISFVPFGEIVMLVFLFSDSQPGNNQWGPNPKEEPEVLQA